MRRPHNGERFTVRPHSQIGNAYHGEDGERLLGMEGPCEAGITWDKPWTGMGTYKAWWAR